jgi:uncharacterized membrane protein
MIDIISWIAVVIVLSAYAYKQGKYFDRANVILFIPVCLPALLGGAYSSAAISVTFGVIGVYKLWNATKH